jgi:hypothetical protein
MDYTYEYEVALSFAGEAPREVADYLSQIACRHFQSEKEIEYEKWSFYAQDFCLLQKF